MYLEEITGSDVFENSETECKARLDRSNVQGWLKTFCGFANASGGTFYLGVEDKSNKLIGFNRKDADNERNYFNNQVNEHVTPRPDYSIDFLKYISNKSELYIIRIVVAESPVKPVILKYKGVPSIYMRRQGMTNGASYEEILRMSIKSQNVQFDTLDSDILYDRKNFSGLFEFCRQRNAGKDVLTDKFLASSGFFNADRHLKNGAVLFSDDYGGSKTAIQCSVFSGLTRGSDRIVSINKYNGNITGGIEYAMEFVRQRMNHSIVKLADSRLEIDAFPERALFESIVNAVAHRDYFLDGTQIQIDLFKDRLEISSPGGFYQGERRDRTYDLSSLISKRRNELICSILVACKAMEAAGTGFEKIEEDYNEADQSHRPYICSESDHFTLVLPDLTYEDGVESSGIPKLDFTPVKNGSKYDNAILEFCYYIARPSKEIAAHIGLSDSSYLRRKILGNLVDNGYLEPGSGSGSIYYKTVADAVRLR